jgi:hypothetical protein
MSDAIYELSCLTRLEEELMRAAHAHPRRRLRRFLAFFGALVIVVPGGYAVAQLLGPDPEQISIRPGDVFEEGFVDTVTGKPILCPDGTLLTQTVKGVGTGDRTRSGDLAECDDGSIPEVYKQSIEDQLKAARQAPVGTNVDATARVRAFRLDEGYKAP